MVPARGGTGGAKKSRAIVVSGVGMHYLHPWFPSTGPVLSAFQAACFPIFTLFHYIGWGGGPKACFEVCPSGNFSGRPWLDHPQKFLMQTCFVIDMMWYED